jgi:hypothetical protein
MTDENDDRRKARLEKLEASSDEAKEKCASSEGWHEQWVRVPPG